MAVGFEAQKTPIVDRRSRHVAMDLVEHGNRGPQRSVGRDSVLPSGRHENQKRDQHDADDAHRTDRQNHVVRQYVVVFFLSPVFLGFHIAVRLGSELVRAYSPHE